MTRGTRRPRRPAITLTGPYDPPVNETVAHINADGRIEYRPFDQTVAAWDSPSAFAEAWLTERRSGDPGPVWSFLWHACAEPQPGIITIVIALAHAADADPDSSPRSPPGRSTTSSARPDTTPYCWKPSNTPHGRNPHSAPRWPRSG